MPRSPEDQDAQTLAVEGDADAPEHERRRAAKTTSSPHPRTASAIRE